MKTIALGRMPAIMAMTIDLERATVEAIDLVVSSGRFGSRDEAIRSALYLVLENDRYAEPLDAGTIALLEERIAAADADPDSGIPAEEVFAELERLCLEDIERQRRAA